MKVKIISFLIISYVLPGLSDYMPYQNLSNSIENSHHSNIVILNSDSIYFFWIEGSNKIYSKNIINGSWTPILPVYSSSFSVTIEEMVASNTGNSIYLFWTEKDSISRIFYGKFLENSITSIDTLYQTENVIEKLKSQGGKSLGWIERTSIFNSRVGLNIMTIPNTNLFLIDSCDYYQGYSQTYNDYDSLYIFWLNNGNEINYKILLDSLNWSSNHIISSTFYYFMDIFSCYNIIRQRFELVLPGPLVTGPYSNGLLYVNGNNSGWNSFEEIMSVGASSPFQEYDISEYPQVLCQSNGKCLVLFQNSFHGQTSTSQNIYLARKDSLESWFLRKNLFPGYVYLNDSALDFNDSLYITFKEDNDVYVGGNELLVGIEHKQANNKLQTFLLSQNYPNPFNPRTTIKYNLPQSSVVSIQIFNNLGENVKTLCSGLQTRGIHEIIFDGGSLPSGIYFYQIIIGNFKQTKKCLLLK